MTSTTSYLEKSGNMWRVVVNVPRPLRPVMGKAKLKRSTGTSSLREANRKKFAIVAAFHEQIETARRETQPDLPGALSDRPDDTYIASEVVEDMERQGFSEIDRRRAWRRMLDMDVQPTIDDLLQRFERHRGDLSDRVRAAYRMETRRLSTFAGLTPETLEADTVDRKMADSFIHHLLDHHGLTVPTVRGSISKLRLVFEQQDDGNDNPFSVDRVPRERRRKSAERERAFTDDEIQALLSGDTSQDLHDLMRIAALTGARAGVTATLRPRDVDLEARTVLFRAAKSETNDRVIPLHTDLIPIVKRRMTQHSDFLFPFWAEKPTRASNVFVGFRRRVGVDEPVSGRKRGLLNLHSFRRWFITSAERAGGAVHVIESIVGHRRSGMSLGTYSAGPSLSQMRDVVESVTLPH